MYMSILHVAKTTALYIRLSNTVHVHVLLHLLILVSGDIEMNGLIFNIASYNNC